MTSIRGSGVPNPVDVHVGTRIRQRRSLIGVSQEKLAESVGITFQQIQKYERGSNRVSASRLFQFSKILDVPVSYFFEQFTGEMKSESLPAAEYGFADNEQESFVSEGVLYQKETLDLIKVYYSIPDPKLRKDLMRVVKTMAENMQTGRK